LGGSAPYSKGARSVAFVASAVAGALGLGALAAALAGCATPRGGIDPAPFLATSAEARVLERAAISCMSDDRCSTRDRIAAWKTLLERFPEEGTAPQAELGLALASIDADRLLDADEALAPLARRLVLPPLVADGLVLALAALDNRRERAASALARLAPLDGRFIDGWLAVRFTRERVLAYKRSGRSEEALRGMSAWIASLRDDSPELVEARRIAESFDDVAIETYLRVRAGRPNPEPIAGFWLTYLVERVTASVLRERRPRSALWLLENPSLSSRIRPSTIDALRLLTAELGRRGTDARARAIVVIRLGNDDVVRRALAFADGLARQTASLASELVVETLFLESGEALERRLGRGVGVDVVVGAFAQDEVQPIVRFAEPRALPVLLAVPRPAGMASEGRILGLGLDATAATKALLAGQPGTLALACIGVDCTDIEPLFAGREEGIKRAARIFLRGPVDLDAFLLAEKSRPTLLGLPDDLELPRGRCLDRVTVSPVPHPGATPTGNWWLDLGADAGALLGAALHMEGGATVPLAVRLRSSIVRARTSEEGAFDANATFARSFVLRRLPCGKDD
jgi:hypothetical protein